VSDSGPARALEAAPCHKASVDVFDTASPADVLHFPAEVFAAFIARVKSGHYDHLAPGADGSGGS